jgi:hypothetical protein
MTGLRPRAAAFLRIALTGLTADLRRAVKEHVRHELDPHDKRGSTNIDGAIVFRRERGSFPWLMRRVRRGRDGEGAGHRFVDLVRNRDRRILPALRFGERLTRDRRANCPDRNYGMRHSSRSSPANVRLWRYCNLIVPWVAALGDKSG